MSNYAVQSDVYETEDIQPVGAGDWLYELTASTRDVLVKIKNEFWLPRDITEFDESLLDTTALVKLTVYRALGWYIFPPMDSFAEGEDTANTRKAALYKSMFDEEWRILQQTPIYDFNEDTVFSDDETTGIKAYKWSRG